jgi:hypothetical protein
VLFHYKKVWNEKTSQLEKQLEVPQGSQTVYTLPFNKENLKELYDQRESDNIQFIVKDETGKAVEIKDMSGSSQKSYELFRDSDFDYLIKGDFIPAVVKSKLRAEAVAQGLIKGGTAF